MKKFSLLLILLIYRTTYAQSYTEKYNDLYNRYEYFNEAGKLIGYKYYESLCQCWKYKGVNTDSNGYIQPLNVQLVDKALKTKQNKYDANVSKMYSAINDIRSKVYNLSLKNEQNERILERFNSECLNSIDSKKLDYSNNTVTLQAVNYLYDCVNSIVKVESQSEPAEEPQATRPKDEVLAFMGYHGGYNVPLVKEYVLKGEKWTLAKSDTGQNYFYYVGNMIWFKRGQLPWNFRDITFSEYSKGQHFYIYSSPYGSVKISDDFKIAVLYDMEGGRPTRKYEFVIGDYGKDIYPK